MVASSMLETREYHGPEPGSPPPPLAALRRVSHRSETRNIEINVGTCPTDRLDRAVLLEHRGCLRFVT